MDHEGRPDPLPPLEGDGRCQLLIVGGGFTGLWAALQAKERIPELDVILIEGTEIGLGASGRNGGFISNTLAHGETNVAYHFPGEVEKLTELGNQNLQEILDALERYQ
jgi:glycine/D-amino acid oxidase-like deaminating enzyme